MSFFGYRDKRPTLLIALACLLGGQLARGTIPEDIVRQGYDVGPTVNLSVRNADGRIFIYGANAPRLEIWAMRRAFTTERLEAIRIAVTIEEESAAIETIYPPAPPSLLGDRSGTVDYMILVPQTCTLGKVELANGEVLIEGMRGPRVEARLGNGVLQLRNCFSASRLTLGRGRLEVFQGWWEAGTFSLSAEMEKGDLRVGLPEGAALHLRATTPGGHIANQFATDSTDPDARKVETEIGGEGPVEFKLRTGNGNIRIEYAY